MVELDLFSLRAASATTGWAGGGPGEDREQEVATPTAVTTTAARSLLLPVTRI